MTRCRRCVGYSLAPLATSNIPAVEYQIRDRLSFMRFLGLGLEDVVPDATTVWLFREALSKANLVKALFERFNGYLNTRGYIARGGQIIDASIVSEVPSNDFCVGTEPLTRIGVEELTTLWVVTTQRRAWRREAQRAPEGLALSRVDEAIRGSGLDADRHSDTCPAQIGKRVILGPTQG